MKEIEKIQRCRLCGKAKLEEQHSACEHSNSMYENETEREIRGVATVIQFLIRSLYLSGLDNNSVHNIVEIAKSSAYDEFYVED